MKLAINPTRLRTRNFPKLYNAQFKLSGAADNFIDNSINSDDGVGFIAIKDYTTISFDQQEVNIKAGTTLFIIKPGKLVYGKEIGAKHQRMLYTLASLRSTSSKHAVCYMPINNIGKLSYLSTSAQNRMYAGLHAQETIINELKVKHGDRFEFVSSAIVSSQAPDLIVKIDDLSCQFEIKGRQTSTSSITLFDKSVRRGTNNDALDEIALVFSEGQFVDFETMIDNHKLVNPAVGFPGDVGTPKSGKLPPEFRIRTDPLLLKNIREFLLNKFKQTGDNYFAVFNKDSSPSDQIQIFYTGVGVNSIDAPNFPEINSITLDTYGGSYKGAMRVAVKVQLSQ